MNKQYLLGSAWVTFEKYEQDRRARQQEKIMLENNERAREQHTMMQESLQQYHAVAEYMRNPQATEILGAGRMADYDDVEEANLFDSQGMYIGTRSGKGRDIILPFLATNRNDSLIVTDIKDGENAYASATARKRLGHKVIALNPFNIAGLSSFRLNPCQTMLDVAQAGYEMDGEDQQFIELFLPMTEKQKQSDNAWALEGARDILRIRAKYLAYFRPSQCNPAGLWYIVHGSREDITRQYQEMIDCGDDTIAQPAATYLDAYENIERQYGGYRTGLNRAVALYAPNSVFAHETSVSDFSPEDLKRERITVFAMLPTDKIEVGSQWLTLAISTMMERIASATGNIRTTVLLDELANLPYMPIIPKALKLFAGKGVRMWGFCQGRHSLSDAGYKQETIREFEDQSGFLQLWEVEDMTLIRDIEGWSGKKGVTTRSASMGGGGGLQGSFSTSETARPVMQTEDIRAVGQGQQLLKVAGCPYLIHAMRVPWYHIPSVEKRLLDVRDISTGNTDWKSEKRKRVCALPAPVDETDSEEPDEDELLAFAVAENEQLQEQVSELKERLERRDQLAADLKDLLGVNNKGDNDG